MLVTTNDNLNIDWEREGGTISAKIAFSQFRHSRPIWDGTSLTFEEVWNWLLIRNVIANKIVHKEILEDSCCHGNHFTYTSRFFINFCYLQNHKKAVKKPVIMLDNNIFSFRIWKKECKHTYLRKINILWNSLAYIIEIMMTSEKSDCYQSGK